MLASTHAGDRRVAALREWQVPFATFGRSWDGDQELAGSTWTAGPASGPPPSTSSRQGHRAVGYVGWPLSSETGRDRRQGWSDACVELGLSAGLHAEVSDEFDAGRAAAHRLLDGGDPATALVCASDTLALGVLRALDERGLRAGRDVGVTGFDNSPAAALCTPGLTSLRQPLEQVAHDLVAAVEELLAGIPTRRQTLLTPELVVRESSLRGPARPSQPSKETP